MKNQQEVAIIVPVYNEQLVIEATLTSLLKIVKARDIYVVNDGSTDSSGLKIMKFTKNILNIYPNMGKANALNQAISKFKLIKRYRFILPVDADTLVSANYLKHTLPLFKDKKVVAAVGRVMSKRNNWISAFRTWEYEVSQTIHKAAQAKINTIIVCPGCSTIYKAVLFKKVSIPTGTLTEDMDLTFQIHRKKLGQIKYAGRAYVFTQDPSNLKDLLRQIDRWYTGFWQCLLKNNVPWGGQLLDMEVAILASEGLFGSLISVVQIIAIPLSIILGQASILLYPLMADFLLFVLPTIMVAAFRARFFGMFRFIPSFYFLRLVMSIIFLRSFLKVVVGLDLGVSWNKVRRYATN